jgi:hypothetical protein
MGSKGGVRRNPNVLWRGETRGRDSKGIILFNYETRSIHFLEDLGKKIWEECQETDFENLIKKLGAEQERDQIAGFIKMLEERSLGLYKNARGKKSCIHNRRNHRSPSQEQRRKKRIRDVVWKSLF